MIELVLSNSAGIHLKIQFILDEYLSSDKKHQSVTWLLIVLTGAVFLIELLVMAFLDSLPSMPHVVTFLLDSTLLTALIFPVFYFLVFRPLVRNITELQLAKDNLRIVSVAFESNDPILITDANAKILRANKKFLDITGYSLNELIGKSPQIIRKRSTNRNLFRVPIRWLNPWHANSTATALPFLPAFSQRAGRA